MPEKTPWYDSNLFWVPFSLGIGILLTVIAAMRHDLRWLLWFSGLCFVVTAWVAARQIQQIPTRLIRWTVVGISAILIYASLYGVHRWLGPTSPTATQTQSRQESPPTVHPVPPGYTVVGHVTIVPPQDGWFSYWGMPGASDNIFRVIVKTEQLSKVQEYCDLIVAVRVDDHMIDEMTDSSIEKSEPFSILLPSLTVDTPLSQKFIQRIFPDTHREGTFYATVKTYLTLVPKGIKAERVSTLSDLAHLDGYILGTAAMNVSISRQIVRGKIRPLAAPPVGP